MIENHLVELFGHELYGALCSLVYLPLLLLTLGLVVKYLTKGTK